MWKTIFTESFLAVSQKKKKKKSFLAKETERKKPISKHDKVINLVTWVLVSDG